MEETFRRDVRGVSLFERRVGEGAPVVVLHGGPGADHGYLRPGFDALAHGRTLIYYDQRGGGESAVSRDTPVGWKEQVADLDALRELWGMESLTLAGYSWGGLLAVLYAIHHPDHVERLALVSPAPTWRAARNEFEAAFSARNMSPELQEERRKLRESGLRESDPDAFAQRIFELSVVPYFHDPSNATRLTPFRVTGRTQQEVWASLGEYDLRSAMKGLRLPAVVVHGESDPIPIATARVTADCLSAELHPIPECGHVPYVEQPEAFARHLGSFLPRS